MNEKHFPLVADDEIMLAPMPQMNLYDDSDFISNIMGDYVEKNYLEWQPIAGSGHARSLESSPETKPVEKEKTYAEIAREEARADLKKKRSAAYLRSESPVKSRTGFFKNKQQAQAKPTALLQKNPVGEYSKYGKNLEQEDYILADISVSQAPLDQAPQEKPSKNNYDFLKKSQIYNPRDKQDQAVSRKQELNLTQFDRDKE